MFIWVEKNRLKSWFLLLNFFLFLSSIRSVCNGRVLAVAIPNFTFSSSPIFYPEIFRLFAVLHWELLSFVYDYESMVI